MSLQVNYTHRPLSSSFLGLPYRILNINHKRNYLGAYGYRARVLKRAGLWMLWECRCRSYESAAVDKAVAETPG